MDGRSAAAAILTQAFADSTKGFATVGALRLVATRVGPYVESFVEDDAFNLTRMMMRDPGLQAAFTDNTQAFVALLGGVQGITQKFVDQYVTSFEASIDISSIILAHSVLDAAVFQFCRASASAAPSDWESMVRDKKVSLVELKEASYDDILRSKVDAFIEGFERESLPKKIDRLFAICKPPATSSTSYSYSRERVVAIDDQRHGIVHGRSAYTSLPEVGNDISFIETTNYFLYNMVQSYYQLPIDSAVLMQAANARVE